MKVDRIPGKFVNSSLWCIRFGIIKLDPAVDSHWVEEKPYLPTSNLTFS
jgi:dTDP-glucose pyrophosphorylase